uniref:Uncharacterized protein n=1 Tax=Timema cristinae TaxID=61476 RepID=A0A7R9DFW4_TIMCR|nr:unnamed protein product [Timema cristinae]
MWDFIDVAVDRRDMWSTPVTRYCNNLIETLVLDVCDSLTESADVVDLEKPKVTIYSCPDLSCRPVKLASRMSHLEKARYHIRGGEESHIARFILLFPVQSERAIVYSTPRYRQKSFVQSPHAETSWTVCSPN